MFAALTPSTDLPSCCCVLRTLPVLLFSSSHHYDLAVRVLIIYKEFLFCLNILFVLLQARFLHPMDLRSPRDELFQPHAALPALTRATFALHDAAAALSAYVFSMQRRVARAVLRTRDASEVIVACLTRTQAAVRSRARSNVHNSLTKLLNDCSEEAGANDRLLDAAASMRDVRQLPALFVRDVDSLPLAFMLRGVGISALLMCSCDVSVDIASSWTAVYRDVVDASMSEVSGPGTVSFVRHDSARDAIHLVPRLLSGAVAEYVSVDDIVVAVAGGSAVVSVGASGCFDCVYTVSEGVREVDMRISVCGVLLWHATVRVCDFNGCYLQSYGIEGTGEKYGLVVTPDCRFMAVSYGHEHKLRVYHLEAGGTASLLHTVGSELDLSLQLRSPVKMCLTHTGHLLVCKLGNDRVQELTGLGEAQPVHVRFLPVRFAWSIAALEDLIAIGTYDGYVQLLNYVTGALIRTIGSCGTGQGQIGGTCTALRFTPDGQYIVVAEDTNSRLSMFHVCDGSFVKHLGVGLVADGPKDVEFTTSGELLVADALSNRLCLFSADGNMLLRSWCVEGEPDGQLEFPVALAMAGSKLFVLDCYRPRVQVFD